MIAQKVGRAARGAGRSGGGALGPSLARAALPVAVLALVGRDERHGYVLIRDLRRLSAGAVRAGEGTIYPLLGRLSARGWVRRRPQSAGGRVRFRYSLTPRGREALTEMRVSWDGLNRFVDRCLGGA